MLSAPPVAVARLAEQLGVDLAGLRSYGPRAKTRTEHSRLVAKYLGWRLPTTLELKELDEFLLARAMEHDSPTLLFRLGCEYLISARVIRPGLVTVCERVERYRPLLPSARTGKSGTRGLPADADRAPIRFPRRARLYV
ncbi:hypothetical protein GCM10023193_69770 [Planotetraspora kaengkrachanensis]|uniref:DUF4158 domain-containing protein n=1 Tax=Planotetraspora kaengkrachanensis TaxID=575193 RepID=A0A8J3PYP6_9ACTN|nr:hypothetical protein Pka01_66560 [Planotetraspora kaengkrachanensis]